MGPVQGLKVSSFLADLASQISVFNLPEIRSNGIFRLWLNFDDFISF